MNKKIKRIVATGMAVAMLASTMIISASAAIPSGYWQYQETFISARDSGDYETTISVSLAIEAVMLAATQDSDTTSILANTYDALYKAYEGIGDYDNALIYLEKYIPYAEAMGWDDAVQIAERRLDMIDPMTEVYALTENIDQSPYFGAINEPVAGTYYGRVYNENTAPTDAESAVSVYVEFLQENIVDYDWFIQDLDDGDHIIHVALNMPNENADLAKVLYSDSYIENLMNYLDDLDSPVFLRIGGEMNVWTDLADPTAFKAAYIKIAEIARELAPDVALVFAPNSISEWNTEIMDYYPGDQYVDWVGISNYTLFYRSGYTATTDADYSQMYYNAGIYANPVTSIRYIIEEFGDSKPIMITEGGSGYQTATGENLTTFAVKHMNDYYLYLNMVYPQIKAIIYFDKSISGAGYQYALDDNSTVKNAYLSATSANPTLLHSLDSSSLTYVPAGEYQDDMSVITLSAYCNPVGDPTVSVSYVLDGATVKSTSTAPYTYELSAASLSTGTHSLTVKFTTSIGYSATKTYSITKGAGNLVAIVEGSTPVTLPGATEPEASTSTGTGTAAATSSTVLVDGAETAFEAYNIADNNYFKLRDIAMILSGTEASFEVTWNQDAQAIEMLSGQSYTPVSGELAAGDGNAKSYIPSTASIYLDGQAISLTAYTINDNNYFKLRDLGEALGFNVSWDQQAGSIVIASDEAYTTD